MKYMSYFLMVLILVSLKNNCDRSDAASTNLSGTNTEVQSISTLETPTPAGRTLGVQEPIPELSSVPIVAELTGDTLHALVVAQSAFLNDSEIPANKKDFGNYYLTIHATSKRF